MAAKEKSDVFEPNKYTMEYLRQKKGFICDMDGVIYHGNMLLPGVTEFVEFLKRENKNFLFLTNSSERAPRELQQKLERLGPVSYTHLPPRKPEIATPR